MLIDVISLLKGIRIVLLHAWESILSLFIVTAIVLTPDSVARLATDMFDFVLPLAEIKQYVLSSLNLEFNKSEGL
jgi:hypothetical protein